ncbi:MAG: threonine dehydratase [Burkholderiales bacterium]|nr:MAG: threonine dehydratase [Burkholderiales bacterium]
MFTPTEIQAAQDCVYASLRPTPQFEWPLLSEALGAKVWVKHENHQPVGAFKVRGGLTYFDALMKREVNLPGVIAATRGNHGQSIAFAAGKVKVPATIVVPHGNSREKNAAMRALGADLIEHGSEFQEAKEHATELAKQRGLHFVPSYHRDLLLGVMTYWIEFFEAVQPDVTYVPIGMGSGFCAAAAARVHTGVKTKLIGVVSAHATAYMDSFKARKLLEAPVSTQIADGMACRVPDQAALDVIVREAHDVIAVTDDEVKAAMRLLFTATHNVAEGAGAASLAAATQQKDQWRGKTVGTTLCGGNVDAAVFAKVLAG